MAAVEKFELNIPQEQLNDLATRLKMTRWPDREPVRDWSQGVPLAQIQSLCDYWLNKYDWRRCEAMLNGFGQFRTEIDGLNIHFLHVRSPEPDALPLVMTHGWPGSVIEFHKVIGPLTNPAAHGGDRRDAFHLVMPSLPGYGFSDKPKETGWGVGRTAQAWLVLMKRLGYNRFFAQGGDWGAAVTKALGALRTPECVALHLNMPLIFPSKEERKDMTPAEAASMASIEKHFKEGTGYSTQQESKPQTLGYGLTDSPAGQAAWVFEKFREWTDCRNDDPTTILSPDELLDNIMLYWLPANATSSGRYYWERRQIGLAAPAEMDIPIGCSIFPKESFTPSRRWVEKRYSNLIHWRELDRGGHFPAFEQPGLFVNEVRDCFRQFR